VVSKENGKKIESALLDLAKDIGSGSFKYTDADEDVHSAIERGLTERCGEIGGAIRAGRSRNDLVVTDFKLYLIDHLLEIASQVSAMVKVINTQAANNLDVIAPGFTHTQHAQPITFAQELMLLGIGILQQKHYLILRCWEFIFLRSVKSLFYGVQLSLAGSRSQMLIQLALQSCPRKRMQILQS